jgi:amino acid adenylation domain-containing protein
LPTADESLTRQESQQLLREWNDTWTDYGSPGCLHQLIESQVDRTPDSVALVCGGRSLTYGELDRRANRLAHRLLQLGVQPESPVGICAERSLELEVALLAILKAGGAYVPLDPEYPRDRLAFMLEDALAGLATPVLLTQGRLLPVLPATSARVVLLDEAAGDRDEPCHRPAVPTHLDQVAYLIYTSGSTGRPKGVMNSHRGIVNRLLWMQETYRLDASDRVLQKTPASFDVSVWELFWPLLTGARLVMALPGGHRDPSYLARAIVEEGVTTAHFVPSMLSLFLEAPEAGRCTSLRRVVCSGEALSYELQQRFQARLACPLHNLYGPTEAAVDVTFWACRRGGPPVVPIGRPVANTRIHILNATLRPVPIGIAGELHIGGVQLARGYWRRPELTAERFVPDPQAAEPGSRLYKTGDLARHRPDGAIEYLGRLDDQVKIRGVRIELGEIEAILAEHPDVREAVVLAREDGPGDKRLVAYLVAKGEGRPSSAELRSFLGSRLPDSMIPAFFVTIPALPLTPSGKVDRRALAGRELPRDSAVGNWAAPRDPTEELLAGIWAEVLGRDRVGIDESFFDLGGDSLLAVRVLARVRAALGLDLPPSAVLEAFTVAALAERLERALAEGRPASSPLPPITPRPRDGGGEPLSFAQRRLWFLERLLPGASVNSIPIVMRLDGPLAPAVLERCLVEIARRHEALRTTVELGPDGEPYQLVVPPSRFPLPLVDLSGLPLLLRPEERDRLARAEARRPLEPGPGALWRCLLLRADPYGHRGHDLLVTFHHVIADGESIQVLEREFAALYSAFLDGRPSPLPELVVQPADVAAWERRELTPEVLAPHLAYFREHLAGAAGLDLPADLPRPAVRTWHGVSHALALPPSLSREIREFARRRGATTYMVLLATWVALLRRTTGQDDVVVGTVLAHRGRPELEGLIGFFANSLPLRVEHPGDPAFGDLLATVRTGALGLHAHQDLPLESVAEALRPGRVSLADPLFQAFFALHGNAGRRELAPGLTLTWREEDHGAAQFDLLLDLEDRGEEIAGRLVASADLFTRAAVERLARSWAALLAGAVARPEAPVSTLALLGAAERHALLVEWSRAPHPPAWSGSVPARIAAWAAATPGAVAVLPAEPGLPALTYGELVAHAHRLARQLRARGVGPDVRVGIYAERSPETLVGMLAVLAAGGAFLPLDPDYPPERLVLLLEDARVPVLLARPGRAGSLPTGGAELVPLQPLAGAAELAAIPAAWEDAGPDDLAYVIYTSGSTGRPKGVLVPHRGFLWAVEALARRSGLEPESRVLQFASASFDASVWEIWSALISGATLVLARREDLLPGAPLLATLRRRGITNVFLTPTALAAIPAMPAMPEGASRELPDLRGLVVGGEAFPPDLVARWAAGRRLWNAYGPTEASICATMARLGEDGQTPIGRPVADNRLLVLGRHLELLPVGVPGELYLGGGGLARGYLGKPDLTAGAFLPDPFSEEAGARLYRTGDLVRFRPDGQLEFLGRADRQVKVRGFRIEPGEIEAQIAEHPGVREAVVVPYEAAPRDLRLAAYVVAAGPAAPSGIAASELRAFLRARLPEHMVPSSFSFLTALPLSPGGKIDRRALPPPVLDELAPASGPAAPRTPVEELLAGIWEGVLGGVEVGAGDDFFDLGGHSLLIGRVLARVRDAFGVELPVRAAFEARTLAALARRVEEALRALPALSSLSADVPARPPLVRVSHEEPLPLSFGQQRLWFLDRLEPGSPVYNLPVAFRLLGPFDPVVLERSLDEVLQRHEALRTTFAEGPDGEPRQVVAPFHPAGLPRVDLAGLPPAAARAEASRQIAREARRPFDLVRGPVARALLLRLGEQEHDLLFSCHHIAFDGWSVGVLRRELGALYAAFAGGQPSPLPELSFQYGDFAAWQRRWLAGEALAGQLAYWRERLAGAPAALELPADRPRPPVQSFRGAILPLAFPAGLAAGLRDLARGQGSTLFMTTLAAFSALLGRFTGQTDLVVGSPVAGRTEAGIEDLLGFFVNTLALRADLGGDPSFHALLGRVRESALSAYAHQDLPVERLVEELQPERDLSRSPLFQVMFSLDPVQGGELAPGLGCELLGVDTGTAKFDLSLFLEQKEGGLAAVLEYATDLFDAATVARLGRSYLCLLGGLVEQGAGLRVSDLPLLGAGERWQILGEWSEPASWATVDACLHDLVAAQVERTPSAVALVAGGERITYRDLGLRAGRLARRLAALGVGPEVRVGVCLSRSPALVVALLGILEAGGAYVPLDPNYPRERLELMLEDAGAKVLVTETALASRLPASRARVLVLDCEPGEPADGPVEAEPIRAFSGNLAYLIYTSGSTGKPKAVAIEHRSAVAFVHWARGVFDPAELASVLASTSISFDLSVFELFVPLACGGRVVLANNILELPELPAAGEVTMVNTVPSAISAMAELVRALPAGVRTVNLAGEPLKGSLAQALYASGVERVRNLYGPSEDTTYSTFETVERGSRREPTIGRPIAGTQARLLDPDLRLVPVGVPGEIHLGGAGLARGYLGRPELTAERFVPDPLENASGERLYRTGDLGRYLPDGRIEYLGRLDHQVKVRGYRIELGEIEVALAAHPRVREAVVVARGEPGSDRFLAAYFVAAGQPVPTAGELRDHLRVRLAEFMVPSSFTWLEGLPLTPNGKVDRKALPDPGSRAAAPGGPAAVRGPVDPLLELLAGIWAEVLGREELPGAHDNFFELGGHSLLATRVVSRVRAALGIELPLRALFAAPTVSALAAVVAEQRAARQGTTEAAPLAPPIEPLAERSDLPLSFAQQRLWLLDRLEPGSPVYNLPLSYLVHGPLDPASLERTLGEVARRHEILRTTFAVAGSGEPRLVVAPSDLFSLLRVDLAGLPPPARAGEAERLTAEEAWRPFDLATGPLFRAALIVTGATEHRFLMAMHHVVTDGWSINVLLGELSVLYQAFAAGLPSPLPELAVQYADFAVWQRRWLEGPVLEAQLAYWRRQLAGAPEALEVPTDRPRPAVETSRGATLSTPLPPVLAAGVRTLSRRQGATLFMVLLSGFAALLERTTGEPDLLLGSPIAGRGRAEVEGLIGFFVNTLVLRADLAGGPSFDALVARVREMALAAYAHQDLPFERLVEELQPQRSLARSPLFQVSFALGVEEVVRELAPGLSLSPLPLENRTSKYDLTLGVDVQGDALIATFEYRTDLFDHATMVRWAGHFTRLLTSVVARPGIPLSGIDLLSAAERHQLAREWNDSRARPASGSLVHHLVAAHARRAPEAPAVISGERRLSYGELERRAARLARTLRTLGCGPEVRIGICLERSPELVVAELAVLKAGGAFVPLDPSYPAARLAYQLEDSQAPVLLTRRGPVADQAAQRGIHCLFPHEDEGSPGAEAGDLPAPALSADNLAYVIYTSGSTGLPKAVQIPHAGLMNLVRWHQSRYGVVPEDRATLVASPAFDASVWEVWPYLAAGASLHVPDGETRLSPTRTIQWWAEQGITLTFLMTPLAEQVLEEPVPPGLDLRVRALITGGDRLHRRAATGAPFRLMNHYGPSEYSVVTTMALVPPMPPILPENMGEALPTLGRPIDDTRVYLLDPHGQPVPLGVAGELHVTGRGLARGYHQRPDLTAERFIPDPFAAEPGGRLYRTGDLARYRRDGEIEFLGRIDQQVKLRGFRIELGEVEAVLTSHPAVERAVVATHAQGPEDVRLLAWVVLRTGEGVEKVGAGDLLAWIGGRLPEFMVPSAVVVLAALPLTPNGKVDRRALPLPAVPEGSPAEPPRSPFEELVAGLWAEILGGVRVGLHDDFFALGGHSLLAIRLLARLRAATGVELPLRAIFANPTVAVLAAEIEQAVRAPGAPPLPPIEPAAAAAGDSEAPASSAQERLWFFHQLDPGGSVLNVPHPLRLTGPLQPAVLAACLAEIARRHATLRTSFAYGAGGLRQRIAPPGDLALPLADLGALPPPRQEEEARRVTDEEAREPFDLAAGPLWRALLLRLGEEEHRLLLTFHHTIVDGWSVDLFGRELAALYPAHATHAANAAGIAPLLPEPALQYTDFVVWQRRWLTDKVLAPQLAYWRRQLAGMPPALDLPTDYPRPLRQSFRGAVRVLPLPPDLSAQVKELGNRAGCTLFMTALAAFAALVGRYTGRTDVVLGSLAANRHRPGTEGVLGFFVGNLVLRLDLAGDPAFRELLHRAREVALGAYAHPDVPFERLVEELDLARDKSRSPLVQVMLSVQTAVGEPLRFAGLSAEPVEAHTATSQFDLTLAAVEGPRGLTLAAEYSTDLFAGSTVERMLLHLSMLLAAVVADPELRLSALPAEIAPRTRPAAAPAAEMVIAGSEGPAEADLARRQALLAERRSGLAAAEKELLASRLRRKK